MAVKLALVAWDPKHAEWKHTFSQVNQLLHDRLRQRFTIQRIEQWVDAAFEIFHKPFLLGLRYNQLPVWAASQHMYSQVSSA